jgi:hypothetical protein
MVIAYHIISCHIIYHISYISYIIYPIPYISYIIYRYHIPYINIIYIMIICRIMPPQSILRILWLVSVFIPHGWITNSSFMFWFLIQVNPLFYFNLSSVLVIFYCSPILCSWYVPWGLIVQSAWWFIPYSLENQPPTKLHGSRSRCSRA